MVSELHRQIAEAVLGGADLRAIEETILDHAKVDEDHQAALWLYAEALRELPQVAAENAGRPTRRGPQLIHA